MESASSSASQRHKKAALAECIELQRKLIQVHEDDAPAAASSSADADADISWYKEQAARLDKFKAALNAVRLQPDEFLVQVAQQWAQPGASAAARDLSPHILRINARSQLTLVRARPGQPPLDAAASTSPGESSVQPQIFFVDMLRHVRVASSEATASSTADAEARSVTLEWKAPTPPPLCCVTPEADELAEVVGAHLRRYNQSRVATVQGLQQAHSLKCVPYSSANPSHERLLRRLWECGFPGVPLTQRCNEHWLHLGFQGKDPATDFRGMCAARPILSRRAPAPAALTARAARAGASSASRTSCTSASTTRTCSAGWCLRRASATIRSRALAST